MTTVIIRPVEEPVGTVVIRTTDSTAVIRPRVQTIVLHNGPRITIGTGDIATDEIWEEEGDLAVGAGFHTAERRPLGPTGQVLTSDGTTAVWAEPTGDSTGAAFVFTQDVPSSLWLVGHNLAMRPNVTVVDTLDREVEADVQYVDDNNLTVGFANPATGAAYLS